MLTTTLCLLIGVCYYIMLTDWLLSQTDVRCCGPMREWATITYYELKKPTPYLAIVRYTAYGTDLLPFGLYEDLYHDTPDDFCRLERDIEIALNSGIDASVLSTYVHEFFPSITAHLT